MALSQDQLEKQRAQDKISFAAARTSRYSFLKTPYEQALRGLAEKSKSEQTPRCVLVHDSLANKDPMLVEVTKDLSVGGVEVLSAAQHKALPQAEKSTVPTLTLKSTDKGYELTLAKPDAKNVSFQFGANEKPFYQLAMSGLLRQLHNRDQRELDVRNQRRSFGIS